MLGTKYEVAFIDDIWIYLRDLEDHANHLRLVLWRLWEHHLYAKLSKCAFWLSEVKFLGHVISQEVVVVDPNKIELVIAWSCPTIVHKIISFLGLARYYQRCVKGFSRLFGPFTALTKNNVKFVWIERCERYFQELKRRLTTTPILALPKLQEQFFVTRPNLV